MKIYECTTDRLDIAGLLLRRGDTISLDAQLGDSLIENGVPLKPFQEPAAPVEVEAHE